MIGASHLKGLLAALSLFTRLPVWRLSELDRSDYARAINYWPFTGFVTGGLMALFAWGLNSIFPSLIALTLALVGRILLTGAFHEDGLGDFLDGMGGGRTKEQVLSIMKDSHVGSYAVLGYALYALLMISTLSHLPKETLPLALLLLDPLARAMTLLQLLLPYARNEETSKLGLCYQPRLTLGLSLGAILILLAIWQLNPLAGLIPLLTSCLLVFYIKRRLGGYTGDTLGAGYLITELSGYLALLASYQLCAS